MAETFTITRAPHPELGVLWSGYSIEYASGDVGMSVISIDPHGPGAKAGMTSKHEGWLITQVNGEDTWSPSDRYESTDGRINATKEGGRIREPFTVTIRQITEDEKRTAQQANAEEIAQTARARERYLRSEEGLKKMLETVSKMTLPGGMTGTEVLQRQEGVDLILRQLPADFKSDIDGMQTLSRLLEGYGWRGKLSVTVTVEGPADVMEQIVRSLPQFVADNPGIASATIDQLHAIHTGMPASDQAAFVKDLDEAARADEHAEERKDECVVCHDRKRRVVMMHKGTGHACVCNQCFRICSVLGKCPICNEKVDDRIMICDVAADQWGSSIFYP